MVSLLEVEPLESATELEAIRQPWQQLWRRTRAATPFQSPDWLIEWWKRFAPGKLWCLALHCAGGLAGVAPLFLQTDRVTPERRLVALGTGISDYLDLVLAPDMEAQGLNGFADMLDRYRDDWDVCDFHGLRPGSPLLGPEVQAQWHTQQSRQEVCPVLDLLKADSKTAHMLKIAAGCRSRLERLGPVEVRRAEREDFDEQFESLARLHTLSRQARGDDGALADANVRAFHRAAAWNFLQANILRLYSLTIGSRIIAGLYALAFEHRVFYYLGGFDPELARYSPGTILIAHLISEARREGATEVDFLRGSEPYKYRWGARDRWTYRLRFWARG